MVSVGGVLTASRRARPLSFFTALLVAFTSACSTTPTAPTDTSATAIVATVSQEPPPVPPRLDALPPPAALGATKFVAFGDSITYGTFSSFDAAFLYDSPTHSYPARAQLSLRQIFPLQAAVLTVINAGLPGESAAQGRSRIASVLTTYDPDGLLLLEGINDLNLDVSPAAAASAVVAIVDVARTYNVTVLLGLMPQTYASVYPPPNGGPRSQSADLIVPFNNELRRQTAGMQNVHIVDLYSRFGSNRSLMGADGLHPTEAGYALMAATFVQAIETVFQVRGSLQ